LRGGGGGGRRRLIDEGRGGTGGKKGSRGDGNLFGGRSAIHRWEGEKLFPEIGCNSTRMAKGKGSEGRFHISMEGKARSGIEKAVKWGGKKSRHVTWRRPSSAEGNAGFKIERGGGVTEGGKKKKSAW